MTVLLAAAALVFALILIAYLAVNGYRDRRQVLDLRAERDASGYQHLLGRTVVLHTADRQGGRSIQGVLTRRYADSYRLESPQWLAEAQPADLAGYVVVPEARVAFVQALDATDAS